MINVEKKISSLVQSQFPSFYQEEGPQFIAFVKAYFEWMESEGNPLYHARRLTDYKDIDTTLEEFIYYFKEKYLKNIQFDTATNKKLLVKNSLDLYRSKGSERSIDLFFNLVYGTNADVKYPREKIFKLSDGVWEKPLYLEVTSSDKNIDYVGKKIVGTESDASAFVEKFIKRKTPSGYISVLYVSNIVGTFTNTEVLGVELSGALRVYDDSPRLIGSLREVLIQDGSRDFNIGDIVQIKSDFQGVGGFARVTSTADATGAVDFIFIDGGWGYTNTSSFSIVSEKILVLSATESDPRSTSYFTNFEKVVEPLVNLSVDNVANGVLSVGDVVTRFSNVGTIEARARVVNTYLTEGVGTILVAPVTGTLVGGSNTYYNANGTVFEAVGISDRTIQGTVMGVPTSYQIDVVDSQGTISVGDTIYQTDNIRTLAEAVVEGVTQSAGGVNTISVRDASGSFKNSYSTYAISNSSVQFNANSSVNNSTYFISTINNYKNGDLVLYRTNTSNSAISGLSNNSTYFVVNSNSTGFKLSRITNGVAIPLIADTSALSDGHFIDLYNQNVKTVRVAANSTSVNGSANFIQILNNPFIDGEVVHYFTSVGNTAITGLANNTTYFITGANNTGVQLAETYNGTPVSVTPSLNETGHNLYGKMSLRLRNASGIEKPEFTGDLSNALMNLGVYDIRSSTFNINFVDSTADLYDSDYIYCYNEDQNLISKARVVTAAQQGNSGIVTVLPLLGYFTEGRTFYTVGNTASAVISAASVSVKGGDFVASDNSNVTGLIGNTNATLGRLTTGTGAGFSIGAIGDSETIYINTDLLSGNSTQFINNEKIVLTIDANPGFSVGDVVFQEYSANTNSNTGIGALGFITTIGSSLFVNGDVVSYYSSATPIEKLIVPFGNTSLSYGYPLSNGDQFYVASANSTGFKLTETREGGSFIYLIPQATSSNDHKFAKISGAGTVVESNPSSLKINDVYKSFNTTNTIYSAVKNYANLAETANVNTVGSDPVFVAPETQYPIERIRAASYGFPKNPQGDINSSIYSCLTFGKFEIGTIGNIFGVDPGIDYNVDPYVLVYQPGIASFNRRDYIFKVDDQTNFFVVGEKISQTPAALTYYDLQVSAGVKESSYNAIVKNFDPMIDIDDANNFIYVPYLTSSIQSNTAVDSLIIKFNSSYDVDSTINFIGVEDNPLVDGDEVKYVTTGSAIGGLANNTSYTVLGSNTSGFQLTVGVGNTSIIDVTRTLTSETHTFIKGSNNFISVASNVFTNNMIVRYYTDDSYAVISGLSNNTLYAVSGANKFGFLLANTANTSQIISVSPSSNNDVAHNFKAYYNGDSNASLIFSSNDQIIYDRYSGSDIGLANNTTYFVVSANTLGFKLATVENGTPLDIGNSSITSSETGHYFSTIPGYLPGDLVYQDVIEQFNGNTAVNATSDSVSIINNQYANGDVVVYYTSTGNTSITGANNSSYVVTGANTSSIKLANSTGGLVALTPTPTSETGHFFKSNPTGFIAQVFNTGANSYVRVGNTTQTFATGVLLLSNTYSSIESGVVSNVSIYQTLSTAEGVIKSIVDSTIYVKRIEFENTFIPGETITGEFSGATANLVFVTEDLNSAAIGTNATIEANVVTSNGTIKTLEVLDSGLSYANSEIVQYYSEDLTRSGTGKAVISGHGISRGYYKSSKGFLSADMKIHDGDYYQEYSYEVLSKISFDRYSDMFKKVMHVAGTKVFGSTVISDIANISGEVTNIETDQIVEFNPGTDIDMVTDSIDVGIVATNRSFVPLRNEATSDTLYVRSHPFVNNMVVRYTTDPGNMADFGLSNNGVYYVTTTSDANRLSLSTTVGGNPVAIAQQSNIQFGHYLSSFVNPFSNNDLVEYYCEHNVFNKNTDIDEQNDFIYLNSNEFNVGDLVLYKTSNNNVEVVNGLTNNTQYVVIDANTSGVVLGNGARIISAVFKYDTANKDLNVYLIHSMSYANVDIATETYDGLDEIKYITQGGELEITTAGYSIVANNYQATLFTDSTESVLFRYNEDGVAPGTISITMVGSQYFKKKSGRNNARYQFIEDKLTVSVPENILLDYIVTDGAIDDVLPTENQGGQIDLLVPVVNFGQANLDFSNNFIRVLNLNPTTSTPLFSNGDVVKYTALFRNIPITGLFENVDYYVRFANSSGFKIATSNTATPIDIRLINESFDPINDVSDEHDFAIIRNNELSTDDPVIYSTNTGYRAVTGLANNTTYYVTHANSVGVKVSTTPRGPNIDISPAPNLEAKFDSFSSVSNTNSFISVANNTFVNGDLVTYTTQNRTNPVTGLSNNANYFVINANTSGFNLSSNGTSNLALTSTKTRLTEFTGEAVVNSSVDFITLTNHTFITNDFVKYYTDGSANTITGLANNTNYYVVEANTAGIKVANTQGGSPIDITAPVGGGNSFFETVTANSQIIKTANSIGKSHFERQLSSYGYTLTLINNDTGAGHVLYNRLPIDGFDLNDRFYVVEADEKTIKLANTVGGEALSLTIVVDEVGHYLKKIVEE